MSPHATLITSKSAFPLSSSSSAMRAVRCLLALSMLPFVWCDFERRSTHEDITENPIHVFPGSRDLLKEPARSFRSTPFGPVGHVAPRAPQVLTEAFQVAEPILTEHGLSLRGQSDAGDPAPKASCSKLLMVNSFAHSYYKPFIREYQPPTCDFDRVVIKFEASVDGRQFDRLGVLYLGDTLVWRTSTSEPVTHSAAHWVWQKDVTPFVSLWKKPQTLIFDLPNIVDETWTGVIKTTLTASFFKSDVQTGGHPPADLIIPITQGLKTKPSQFTVPQQKARRAVNFPRNANRAVFTVDVKSEGNEEFWWANLPESSKASFPRTGTWQGHSPWREVQVELDGRLIGVVWPFPVVYTGGLNWAMHFPIVGIDAYDEREQQIDITPWLPWLCDGERHTFAMRVVGLDETAVPRSYAENPQSWFLSGKVFVWLDEEGSITSGTIDSVSHEHPEIDLHQKLTRDQANQNATLEYTLTASREFSVSSWVKTQKHEGTVSWTQGLKYSNTAGVYQYGRSVANILSITGASRADGPGFSFSTRYSYPVRHEKTESMDWDGVFSVYRFFDQGLDLSVSGSSVFPTGLEAFVKQYDGSVLTTWRNSSSHDQFSARQGNFERHSVQTKQIFNFGAKTQLPDGSSVVEPLYDRQVEMADMALKKDTQNVAGQHR